MNGLCFLAFAGLLFPWLFCDAFVCRDKNKSCSPYSVDEYSKPCPEAFYKCSHKEPLKLYRYLSDQFLVYDDAYYQTFSRDPCIPNDKVNDGHFDCPFADDEKQEEFPVCDEDKVACPVFPWKSFLNFPGRCIDKSLFCNVDIDKNCHTKCQPKQEVLSNSTALVFQRITCDKELEFDCGSFCIPKVWQHDLQVDCANKQDEAGAPESIFKCHVDEIKCPNEAKCIHQDHLCDGEVDCLGATDEFNCSRACPVSLHQCSNGQCIAQNLTCDGVHDCFDKSDEANCSSVKYRDDNLIICAPLDVHVSKDLVCDGNADCPNGFDERNCSISPICDNLHFECKTDHMCVPRTYLCDGIKDCHDGSDEAECPAATSTCPLHQKLCFDGSCKHHCPEPCGLFEALNFQGTCQRYDLYCGEYDDVFYTTELDVSHDVPDKLCEPFPNATYYKCDPKDPLCQKDYHQCCDYEFTFYTCPVGYSARINGKCTPDNQPIVTGYCSSIAFTKPCFPGFDSLFDRTLLIEEKYNAKLLMTSLNEVSTYDIMTGTVSFLTKEFGPISASAYWIKNQTFFWADPLMKQILSCSLPLDSVDPFNACDNSTVLHLSNVSTHSMAFDWAHRLLYFSDDDGFSINVFSMDSKLKKTLYRSSFQSFRSIQVDPALGKLYFVASGKVYEAHVNLAENNRKELIPNFSLHSVKKAPQPVSAVFMDIFSKRLYYSASKNSEISSVYRDERMLHFLTQEARNPVFSIVLFGKRIYWTDQYGLHTVDDDLKKDVALQLSPGIGRPLHLQVIHKTAQPSFTDKCSDHVCDQLCFPIPFHQRHLSNVTYVCECGDGYTMVDEICVEDSELVTIAPTTTASGTSTTEAATTATTPKMPSSLPSAATGAPTSPSYVEHVKTDQLSIKGVFLLAAAAGIMLVALTVFVLFFFRVNSHKPVPMEAAMSFNDLRNNDNETADFHSGILASSTISFPNPIFENEAYP